MGLGATNPYKKDTYIKKQNLYHLISISVYTLLVLNRSLYIDPIALAIVPSWGGPPGAAISVQCAASGLRSGMASIFGNKLLSTRFRQMAEFSLSTWANSYSHQEGTTTRAI